MFRGLLPPPFHYLDALTADLSRILHYYTTLYVGTLRTRYLSPHPEDFQEI